jgi:hypothetical protein
LLAEASVPSLARGDTADIVAAWEVRRPYPAPLFAAVALDGDERAENNVLPLSVVVGISPGSLRITELMANPGAGEGQWVEVTNTESAHLSLGGCRLVSGGNWARVAEPAPLLAPGDYLVLAQYPDSLRLRYGFSGRLAGLAGSFPHLNRSADADRTVRLEDAARHLLDRATYPVPEPGRSLELVSLGRSGDDAAAWQTVWGAINATPGMPNQGMTSPAPSATLTVSPSPPADTVGLALDLPEAPVYLTIRVYDALGRGVRRVVDGEQWPAHGYFRWDGLTEDGSPAPTGVYIVLVEATAAQSGRSYRIVRSVVIARRR